MTVTLEDRVEVLEGKVENLETLREFRRELTGKLAEFDKAQQKQSPTLDIHTGNLGGLEEATRSLDLDIILTKNQVKEFKEEVSGKFERLDNDVTWLKDRAGRHDKLLQALSADVANLGDDITGLTVKVDRLQADVTGLKADVTGLKGELAEFKVEVRGTLAEILYRLPPKAA